MRLVRGTHGYIHRGISGWTVTWMFGPNDYEMVHGVKSFEDAIAVLWGQWNSWR